MCGIAGFISKGKSIDSSINDLKNMINSLEHRGPDSQGTFYSESEGIFMGHTRLSIIDVSSLGSQPMTSSNGRYVIVFNGEIFNHFELRNQLISKYDAKFKSGCDTESLLEYIQFTGINKALEIAEGQFAFALLDKKKKEIFLARDRMGEKPLYYGIDNNILFFASELKAIKAHSKFSNKINQDALRLFLQLSYVPAPDSIYASIQKLLPATYIKFSLSNLCMTQPIKYWDDKDFLSFNFTQNDSEAIYQEFKNTLNQSVKRMMIADVPIGSFLSGGIDSSLITALMQANSTSKIRTFTVGMHEEDFSEVPHAKIISSALGTDHTEIFINPDEFMGIIPNLTDIFDEPFADSSQIPSIILSNEIKKHVTVALSGDGCDELFGGYNRYTNHAQLKYFFRMPSSFKNKLTSYLSRLYKLLDSKKYNIHYLQKNKVKKAMRALRASSFQELYFNLISSWDQYDTFKSIFSSYEEVRLKDEYFLKDNKDSIAAMMHADIRTYLPDDILVKVDRSSMSQSLEVRAPYLDKNLVELAYQIPSRLKVSKNTTKLLPRKLLSELMPGVNFNRPKQGFAVPLTDWLKSGPIHVWANDLLTSSSIQKYGYLNHHQVNKLWKNFCEGKNNEFSGLWNIIILQSWLESNN